MPEAGAALPAPARLRHGIAHLRATKAEGQRAGGAVMNAFLSRTSVMVYTSDPAHNVREIGAASGVAPVLEGSVQRAGNRVRVTARGGEAARGGGRAGRTRLDGGTGAVLRVDERAGRGDAAARHFGDQAWETQ